MRTVRLVLHQLRYDRKRLQRDPAGLFYAVGMPLIFLFVFVAILGSSTEVGTIGARTLVGAGYYLPAIITLSAVSATFVQLSVSITAARERGTLKRVRGTPVPTWVFIAGRIGMSVLVTLLLVVLVIAVGWAIADVSISRAAIPGAILALVVAAASLSCAAFAFSAAVPSPGLAAAAGFGGTLVLYFLSGMFVHTANIPVGRRASPMRSRSSTSSRRSHRSSTRQRRAHPCSGGISPSSADGGWAAWYSACGASAGPRPGHERRPGGSATPGYPDPDPGARGGDDGLDA